MIILMKKNATPEQIDHVTEWIASVGYKPHLSCGVERTLIGAIGDERGKFKLLQIACQSIQNKCISHDYLSNKASVL